MCKYNFSDLERSSWSMNFSCSSDLLQSLVCQSLKISYLTGHLKVRQKKLVVITSLITIFYINSVLTLYLDAYYMRKLITFLLIKFEFRKCSLNVGVWKMDIFCLNFYTHPQWNMIIILSNTCKHTLTNSNTIWQTPITFFPCTH